MPIGMPGCPEFAACTASIVNARMAFDMRCFSDGFGMRVSSGRGTIKSVTCCYGGVMRRNLPVFDCFVNAPKRCCWHEVSGAAEAMIFFWGLFRF
jgi:hypothetical protein